LNPKLTKLYINERLFGVVSSTARVVVVGGGLLVELVLDYVSVMLN